MNVGVFYCSVSWVCSSLLYFVFSAWLVSLLHVLFWNVCLVHGRRCVLVTLGRTCWTTYQYITASEIDSSAPTKIRSADSWTVSIGRGQRVQICHWNNCTGSICRSAGTSLTTGNKGLRCSSYAVFNSQPFYGPSSGTTNYPGEPVPEENSWISWCKARLTEADTLTIRLGATPSGLTSAHLHHSPKCSVKCSLQIDSVLCPLVQLMWVHSRATNWVTE